MNASAPWWAVPLGVILGAFVTGLMSLITAGITSKANKQAALTARFTAYDERLWERRVPMYLALAELCSRVEEQVADIYNSPGDTVPPHLLEGAANFEAQAEEYRDRLILFGERQVFNAFGDLAFALQMYSTAYRESVEEGSLVLAGDTHWEWTLNGAPISDMSEYATMLRVKLAYAIQGPEYIKEFRKDMLSKRAVRIGMLRYRIGRVARFWAWEWLSKVRGKSRYADDD